MKILTKKKQIRGNKVPNNGGDDEVESELQWRQGREVEMSVRERQRVCCDLGRAMMATRERGRDERVIERVRKRFGLSYNLG